MQNGKVKLAMEESKKQNNTEAGGDKEILYTRAIKAGKRIYYLDVKKNLRNDLFLAITESKRIQAKDGSEPLSFEKHKIFLYKEDFEKFIDGLNDVMNYVYSAQGESQPEPEIEKTLLSDDGNIKLDIDFDTES